MADQDPETQPVDQNQSNEQVEQGEVEEAHTEDIPAAADAGEGNAPQENEVEQNVAGGEDIPAEQPGENEDTNAEQEQTAADAEEGDKSKAVTSEQVEQPEVTDEQAAENEIGAEQGETANAAEQDQPENKPEEPDENKAEQADQNQNAEVTAENEDSAEQGETTNVTEQDQQEEPADVTEQDQQEEPANVTEQDQQEEPANVTEQDQQEEPANVTEQDQQEEPANVTEQDQQEEPANVTEQDQQEELANVIEQDQQEVSPQQEQNEADAEQAAENVGSAEQDGDETNAAVVDQNDNQADEDRPEQGKMEPGIQGEPETAPPPQEQVPEVGQQEEPSRHPSDDEREQEEAEVLVEQLQNGGATGHDKTGAPKHMVNLDATATVKFVLMPSGQVVTLACTLGQTLEALKTHFAFELKMPSSLIMLMFDGKGMSDSTTLADLGVGPNGTVQLEMQSADPVNTPLKPYRPRQEYHMPDVITVRVMTEDCEAKDVVVEIERSRTKKPFLGGFRNKNTGVEFHNAAAQTMQKPRPPPTSERFCRDTQTCEQRNTRQQTTNTTSTQMTGVGVYISNMEDKLVIPGKYVSADEYWTMILSKVIILQKYYRRWLAKRYVKKLKEDKEKRLEWERQEEMRKKKEKEERIKREYARRINPKTKADFDMLLHCLEKWRQEEMERINSTLTGAERKAAMCMLLDQETELLSAIERHKNEANKDNHDKRIMAFLEKAAAPKKWQAYDGKLTYMDTPFTIRAKELRDIYNSINMKYLTQDERLDVLLTLKHTVKEHDCKLTQEIIELIDREADLLMRGVKESNLTGLRKRISTLFLQYIKTPTFNPEAARLLKVPQDPSTLRKNINYCHSCGSYLPSTEFFITSNTRHVGRCRRCEKIENDGRQREDHNYYRVMLRALRKSEEAMQDGSKICYLLQENDLRYLVENIWSNQSVLSAWNDLYDLVLCRWDKHQEWSPWNCILLTHDEAEAHKKLFSLEEGYGHVFIHKVTQKHNFARNYFSRLPGMAEALREKLGSRELSAQKGPAVAGHSVAKAQKV